MPAPKTRKVMSICGIAQATAIDNLLACNDDQLIPIDLGELTGIAYEIVLPAGKTLQELTEDFQWLSGIAVTHNTILQQVFAQCTVIPFRIGAFFDSVLSAKQALVQQKEQFQQQLRNIAGMQEWSFKVYQHTNYNQSFLEQQPAIQELASTIEQLSEGKRFLLRKKLEKQKNEALKAIRSEQIQQVGNDIAAFAKAIHVGKIISKKLTGRSDDMVFNLSALIPANQAVYFQQLLMEKTASFEKLGLEAVLFGPSPTYHFIQSTEESLSNTL